MLRRLLESVTGVATGADMPLPPVTMLQMTGMIGENIIDERVWVVKSHHPNHSNGLKHTSNKVICCVRNPLDIIPSYVNLLSTLSHSEKLAFPFEKDYPEWWDKQVTC